MVKPEFKLSSASSCTLSNEAEMTLVQNGDRKDCMISGINSIKHQLQDICRNLNAKAFENVRLAKQLALHVAHPETPWHIYPRQIIEHVSGRGWGGY